MSQTLKISKYIGKDDKGNDLFELTVPPSKDWDKNPTPKRIKVAHDYVEIFGGCAFMLEGGVKKPETQREGASNWLSSYASIQIPIRDMYAFVLPHLQGHKYLQPDHFEDRVYTEDDIYWEKYPHLTGPRYNKGDKYPCYAFDGGIIYYNNHDDGIPMVAFRRNGETTYSHVTVSVFDSIKEHIQLSYGKDEITK